MVERRGATTAVPAGASVIVGAGPAGLAVAAALRHRGLAAVILERGDDIASTWRNAYDCLRLNTVRWVSGLPGSRVPRSAGPWVGRDDFVAYLDDYRVRHNLVVRTGVEVERVRWDRGLVVDTAVGSFSSSRVVVATGPARQPSWPEWPGRPSFAGEVLHSSSYRRAEPFRGRDVLVVGSGNSAADIACDLHRGGADRVRVAVRTPPQIVPRSIAGLPTPVLAIALGRLPAGIGDRVVGRARRSLVGDLPTSDLAGPPPALSTHRAAGGPDPIVDAGFVDGVRRGAIEIVAGVADLVGDEVLLDGGERIRPDAVIAATGYRPGLEPLVGHLGVLDPRGRPVVHGPATHREVPGLHFVGFTDPLGGNLRQVRIDANRIAREAAPADPYADRWWVRSDAADADRALASIDGALGS